MLGGGGLVSHIRKSYSLGDLSEDQQMKGERHEVDGGVYENYREMRRSDGQTPRRMIPITNDSHMYFPEVDAIQRPVASYDEYYGVTSEEGSPGNLSRDQINYGYQVPHMEPLIRTASMGASTRARTRASARNALPKRSSLTESSSQKDFVSSFGEKWTED
ncbi:hypothetical protein RUM43_007383 [Polyplax serrata]|uniref:Uncharacterized protein n=1 Tax=Polyplax serrata TaxID=468196 RepID=A0AAN8PM62_POLSC